MWVRGEAEKISHAEVRKRNSSPRDAEEGGGAIFSACGRYRYLLTRQLGEGSVGQEKKVATFIMLNPSTADATRNDPTIRKCIGFAQRWQCERLQVLNLFAVRATLPRDMKRADEPIGSD